MNLDPLPISPRDLNYARNARVPKVAILFSLVVQLARDIGGMCPGRGFLLGGGCMDQVSNSFSLTFALLTLHLSVVVLSIFLYIKCYANYG